MSPPKIVHAPACDRKTASASAVFVHFQRRKKFFHGSTLISHSTGHPKTGIPSADNGAKPGHGYSGVKRHSPCQRRTPSDALIAVALHPGAGHCSTDPMLSVRCRRRYSHCCVVLFFLKQQAECQFCKPGCFFFIICDFSRFVNKQLAPITLLHFSFSKHPTQKGARTARSLTSIHFKNGRDLTHFAAYQYTADSSVPFPP